MRTDDWQLEMAGSHFFANSKEILKINLVVLLFFCNIIDFPVYI